MRRKYQRAKLLPWYAANIQSRPCSTRSVFDHIRETTSYEAERSDFEQPSRMYVLENIDYTKGAFSDYSIALVYNPAFIYMLDDRIELSPDTYMDAIASNHGAYNIISKYSGLINYYAKTTNGLTNCLVEHLTYYDDLYPLDSIGAAVISTNPGAASVLKKNPSIINWWYLSMNKSALDIIEANPDKINYEKLCYNEAAMHIIKKTAIDKQYLADLAINPAAIRFLEQRGHVKEKLHLIRINFRHTCY
jgi:hypothetical protein